MQQNHIISVTRESHCAQSFLPVLFLSEFQLTVQPQGQYLFLMHSIIKFLLQLLNLKQMSNNSVPVT